MREHPIPVERVPLFLHFTYSLCLHAAALSFLISVPVFGVSGTPGRGYVVTLTGQVDQPGRGNTIENTNLQPAGEPGRDRPADIGPGEKDAGTGGPNDDGKNDVAEDIQLPKVADAAGMQTGSSPVAHKPEPVPIPSNISPELTVTAKPFLTEVPSEPLAASNAGTAIRADAPHQAKTETPAQKETSKTAAAVKPMPTAAPPTQEKPSAKPDVPEVLPDPEPEPVAVTPPMFIPAKPVIAGPDNMLPPGETTPPVPDKKIAPKKTTAKAPGKGDVSSSPDAIGTSTGIRGKDPIGRSHPTGKPAGTVADKRGGQAGSGDSDAGGLSSGSGTSSKKGGTGGPAKSGGQPGAGGDGDVGTGNKSSTSPGPGKGYKFAGPSLPREFGLLRGTGDALGEPGLARREGPSGRDIPEKGRKGTEETPPVAILVPEALLVRDIKIEVVGEKKALSDISMGLTIRAHPTNRKKHAGDAERKIEAAEITIGRENPGAAATKTLMLKKAEKGFYIFSLTNTGDASSVAVVFHLYGRSEQERIKEYKSFPLPPSTVTKFRFLMPEALFWDDTDRFSGSIEDSHSVTKFRYETGLIWKEVKE